MKTLIASCCVYLFAFFMGRYTHDQSFLPTLFGVGLTFVAGTILTLKGK